MENSPMRIPTARDQTARRSIGHKVKSGFDSLLLRRGEILQEETCHNMLTLERRRAERSRKPFVLMLLDASGFVDAGTANRFMSRVTSILMKCTRETDLVGWHKNGLVLGVIFTEISLESENPITEILHSKVVSALHDELNREVSSNLVVTAHLFPESADRGATEPIADARLYPDLSLGGSKKRLPRVVKRVI